MSMPNFNTMRNFPLYVRDFVSEVDYCPACNTYGEDGVCPICGAATERKVYLDEVAAFEFAEEMETRLSDANAKLEFHSISTVGGKYYGFSSMWRKSMTRMSMIMTIAIIISMYAVV